MAPSAAPSALVSALAPSEVVIPPVSRRRPERPCTAKGQLIECLYSRVVYHMHPNTLRVAKAISWIYFLHGKIGRFIGPYKMLRQTYHRHLRSKAGERPRALPWRPNRGSRKKHPKANERKYVASESKRLARSVVNTQSTAQSLLPSCTATNDADDDEAELEDAFLD